MRTLLLMRHAQAAPARGLPDHDRPLDADGRGQAERAGARLAERHGLPEAVWSSTAQRARETVERMGRSWPEPPPIACDAKLYLADRDRLLAAVADAADDVARLLVVAHNPGIARFAADLAGTPSAADGLRGMPPSTVAALAVDGSWAALTWGSAELIDVILPDD